MINSLRIENFVLINSLTIEFNAGFTVVTGETGSGKSILLNALNLILGERANFSVIGNNGDKSIVEAEVNIQNFGLESFFQENDLDYFETAIVRREIHKQGRSRAFINDTPVQLSILKEFSSQLIHIHSQYNTLELKDLSFQLKVLDILAGTTELKEQFGKSYLAYKIQLTDLEEKKEKLKNSVAQSDYNSFQLNELTSLNIDNIDYEVIQDELKKGENADEIRQGFSDVVEILKSDNSVIDSLGELNSLLSKRIDIDANLANIFSRIDSILIELNDIADEANNHSDSIELDPRRLQEMIAQIDSFNHLLQKHNLTSLKQLRNLKTELESSSENHEQLEKEIELLGTDLIEKKKKLDHQANQLHEKRVGATSSIQSTIKKELSELKLENTELIFSLDKLTELTDTGNTKLSILFSPNAGTEPVPIHKAASGGELSRVMLALQNLMSSKVKLRSILFDEIDTGVSGDVAQKMANTLQKMGERMQVIAITHLPQVAAKGRQHLKVLKTIQNNKTISSVIELNAEDSIIEVARLMSGDEINQAALENAKALMN